MTKRIPVLIVLLTLAALGLAAAPAGPARERFFDTASADHSDIRLVVFNPTLKRVKDIIALGAEGMIPLDGLTVIGVYHRDQTEDFEPAKACVRDERLDWFKFHEVQGVIGPAEVHRPNALSPEIERIFRLSDGMVFTGGPDIPPELYGKKTSLLTVVEDPARHTFEVTALSRLLGGSRTIGSKPLLDSRPGYPILAICLGAQSLNVAAGGTLTQDIWTEVYGQTSVEDIIGLGLERWHSNPHFRLEPGPDLAPNVLQPIVRAGKGRLWRELGLAPGDRPYTLSSHHQAMKTLGRGLLIEAVSPDGRVAEALSHERFPGVLAVQFHPEASKLWDASLSYRLSPREADPPSWRAFLEARPPSLDFHRKLWGWFFGRLRAGDRRE